MNNMTCPLCDLNNAYEEYYPEQNVGIKVSCEFCKDFIVAGSDTLYMLQGPYKDKRQKLSTLSRERKAKGLPPLAFTTENLEELLRNC